LFGFFKMKLLFLGLLLASPPLAAWMLRGSDSAPTAPQTQPVETQRAIVQGDRPLKVPVEVVSKGSEAQWVYVQVAPQAIPEPSSIALLAVGSLLLLRRQRSGGK
jgi:hypothetical protein